MITGTLVGQVAVDSGQIMIIDPCYINADFVKEFDPATKGKPSSSYEMNYDGCCNATLSSKGYGQLEGLAIACGTLYGDGVYPVYAEFDNRNRVKTLTIDFDPQEDDSLCDHCGEDMDWDCRCNDEDEEI
jgi:hypothetical protein